MTDVKKYIPVDSYVANTGTFSSWTVYLKWSMGMITISQTSSVKIKWSINRDISKFNSGLCYWRLYHFILSLSETLGWFCLLVITICSRGKQPLVSNDVLLWAFSPTASKPFLFITCTLIAVYRYFSIVFLSFLKMCPFLSNQCTLKKKWQNGLLIIK